VRGDVFPVTRHPLYTSAATALLLLLPLLVLLFVQTAYRVHKFRRGGFTIAADDEMRQALARAVTEAARTGKSNGLTSGAALLASAARSVEVSADARRAAAAASAAGGGGRGRTDVVAETLPLPSSIAEERLEGSGGGVSFFGGGRRHSALVVPLDSSLTSPGLGSTGSASLRAAGAASSEVSERERA
jgi:hypothetical protein